MSKLHEIAELGRLRAEVERLKVYEQLSWEVKDMHEEIVEVPKAEDLVKEIIRLRARVAELEGKLNEAEARESD